MLNRRRLQSPRFSLLNRLGECNLNIAASANCVERGLEYPIGLRTLGPIQWPLSIYPTRHRRPFADVSAGALRRCRWSVGRAVPIVKSDMACLHQSSGNNIRFLPSDNWREIPFALLTNPSVCCRGFSSGAPGANLSANLSSLQTLESPPRSAGNKSSLPPLSVAACLR